MAVIVITGILGRTGLGRFSLGRIPRGASSGVPCPYRPSSLAQLSQRVSFSVSGPASASIAPREAAAAVSSAPGRFEVSQQIPAEQARAAESAAARPAMTDSRVSSQPVVVPSFSARMPTAEGASIHILIITPDSAGAEPKPITDTDAAKPAPTADQAPARRQECR